MSPSVAALELKGSVQFVARDAKGNAVSASWTSSSSDVATVSSSGIVTGVASGSATITAKVKNQTASASVTVDAPPSPVASLKLTPDKANLEVGAASQLKATALDADGKTLSDEPISWKSSKTSVATVSSSGKVTAVAAGGATITASAGGETASSAVTVTAPASPSVATVTVSPTSVSMLTGETAQLTATAKDGSGNTLSGLTFTWASSNPAVATVSASGSVSGVAGGTVVISAEAGGKSGGSAVTVSAPAPAPPPNWSTPDFAAIKRGIRPRGFGASSYGLLQPAAGGMMYYVSTSGNDNNTGSSTSPFRTINKAAQVAVAGDVVTIRNGTYQESVFVRNSGTAGKRIVFQAENRGGVVLTGGRYVFQPQEWYGILNASRQTHVTVRGLIFRQYAENVVSKHALRTARGWIVDDCLFDNSGYTGVQVNDHDVTIVRTTMQYHYAHAYIVSGGGGGTSPTDPAYKPVENFRLLDGVVRSNHTTSDPLGGGVGTSVSKIGPSRNALVENNEMTANNGAALWFDEKSTNYVIRRNYIHANRGYTINGTYNAGLGRGMYIEKNWAGGMIEENLVVGNSGPGVFLVNSNGVVIRNNMLAQNDQCVNYVHIIGSGYELFTLKDIQILSNQCKDWARWSGIHAMGGTFTTPWEMNIYADGNTYEPVRAAALAWWPAPIHGASTLPQVRSQFRWETNGRVASITVP